MKSILIIEDDLTFNRMLKAWFAKKEYNVDSALTASAARKKIVEMQPDIVICDLRLPDGNGVTILKWIKQRYPEIVVIMMTGYADIQTAVSSIKAGAFDYISKPFNPEELFQKINESLIQIDSRPIQKTKSTLLLPDSNEYFKGTSEKFSKLYEFVNLVAPTKLSVLIKGESGVGKEHIARMIHDNSECASGPFIAVDCGIISKELASSDFFGHIKGAFTGAINNKIGYFLSADKGTLFLDEIGNLPINIQIHLLRVLQEKKVKPVGSEKEYDVDIRIISATNEDIDFAVNNGYFRTDLYHRINEFTLEIPALRESIDDLPAYLRHFLMLSNKFLNKNVKDYTPEAMDILTKYDWPGNIRELKNIINRLTLISKGDYITANIIPDHFKKTSLFENSETLDVYEKKKIEDALNIAENNVLKASSILGIDTKTLYIKLKLYGINHD